MKNLWVCFSVILIVICNSVVAQNRTKGSLSYRQLTPDIAWSQVLVNKNRCFVAGFKNGTGYLYDCHGNSLRIFPNVGDKSFAFLGNGLVYFGSLGMSNPTDLVKNKILIFNLSGRLEDAMEIGSRGYVTSYCFAAGNSGRVAYVSIKLNEFMEGKTKGIQGGIFAQQDSIPFVRFRCPQSPPPTRVDLPIVAVRQKIYLAFQNEYKIDVYSKNGKRLSSITNPNFKQEPYSKDEIGLLSTMQKSAIKQGVTGPPIIGKIDVTSDGTILVTRCQRPGAAKLFVDKFNSAGKYTKTIELELGDHESYIDAGLTPDMRYYCLIAVGRSGGYRLRTYSLKY